MRIDDIAVRRMTLRSRQHDARVTLRSYDDAPIPFGARMDARTLEFLRSKQRIIAFVDRYPELQQLTSE